MKPTLLIIYHSQSGNTRTLAEAIFESCVEQQMANVILKTAKETNLEDVLAAQGILIATPEYFGTMSGALKDFFDRTYYPAHEYCVNVPYALLVCCENEGQGTVRDVQKIAQGYTLRKSLEPMIIKDVEVHSRLQEAREFGLTFLAGLEMSIF